MNAYEDMSFRKYMFKAKLDKAIHTLEGIIRGISIDYKINNKEIEELENWLEQYMIYQDKEPFSELIEVLVKSLEDSHLDQEEYENIIWLCNNLKTNNLYFDVITSDIQRLHGILHGVLSDNVITEEEIIGLQAWIKENGHLSTTFPYDEIYSLLVSVLSDGKISDEEKTILKVFFSEFVDTSNSLIDKKEIKKIKKEMNLSGICSVCPEIQIKDRVFCFTGKSSKTTREGFSKVIKALGGIYNDRITQKTDYLIVGNEGNPCWAFSCYGRKVEAALNLRKKGHKIIIAHENDFWDTIKDIVS